MRLTVVLLGFELDITLGPELGDDEPEFRPYQDAGYTGSTPIGFTRPEVPFGEMDCPPHQFDPGDDSEDV